MLIKLKEETLKCLLFLKYVERIAIYERQEEDDQPVKIFEIEMINALEVRQQRAHFLSRLKDHLDLQSSDANKADVYSTLDYSVRPQFKLTQQDGTVTTETWQVCCMVGNATQARDYMMTQFNADVTKNKMIPWVAVASPVDPDTKIESRL